MVTPTHLLWKTTVLKHADYFNVEFYAYNFFSSGAVWSWGDGDFGKLGRGGSEGSKSPKVIPGFGDIVKIKCGRQFSVALTREGKVFTWQVALSHTIIL